MKTLLIPLSWLYALGLHLRYALYAVGILKRIEPSVKTIVLGNLLAGGTGKTPHAIFIGHFLKKEKVQIAFLSRGYGRKSIGFRKVELNSTSEEVGDEALLIKTKFSSFPVAVCEDRVNGIISLLREYKDLDVVILDDAFQHLKLKGGFYILLDRCDKSALQEVLLPAGLRRDLFSATSRADLIIKSRSDLEVSSSSSFSSALVPVINSLYRYTEPEFMLGMPTPISKVILLTALAHANDLRQYLASKYELVQHFSYGDHHSFTEAEIEKSISRLKKEEGSCILMTSSKDWMRLKKFKSQFEKNRISVAVQNIEVDFINNEHKRTFEKLILDYAGKD